MTIMQPGPPYMPVMQTMPVVLNSGLSVKAKYVPSQCNKIINKNVLKKGSETKKVWLKQGLNPQLSWSANVLSTWF